MCALTLAPPVVSTPRSRHAAAPVELPRSSQWSSVYRRGVSTASDVGVRRRVVRGGGGLMAMLAARERGVNLPARLRPARLVLSIVSTSAIATSRRAWCLELASHCALQSVLASVWRPGRTAPPQNRLVASPANWLEGKGSW